MGPRGGFVVDRFGLEAAVEDADESVAELAVTVYVTVPGPLPVAPPVTVIHPAELAAVHGQPAATATVRTRRATVRSTAAWVTTRAATAPSTAGEAGGTVATGT